MDPIRRALFSAEYLRALNTLTRFNRPAFMNVHFLETFLYCFSEIELRQVWVVMRAKMYELNNLFSRYRPYDERIRCRSKRLCPAI